MKEYTVTYTVDVTEVLEQEMLRRLDGVVDVESILTDKIFIETLEEKFKARCFIDDVRVRNFKVFVRDLDTEEESEKDDDQN